MGSPIRIADLLRKVMAFTLRTPSKSAAPLFSWDFCVRDTPRCVIAVRGKVRADIPGTCFGERDFSFLRRKAVHVKGKKILIEESFQACSMSSAFSALFKEGILGCDG